MNMQRFRRFLALPTSGLLLALLLAGCDATNPDDLEVTDSTVNEDVAASVATLVADASGGMLDQVGDLAELTSASGLWAAGKDGVERVYNEATGTWTVTVDRERSNPPGTVQMSVHRVYTVQFLNAEGLPQKYYITEGDTARTLNFQIVEGSGTFQTPRVTAERTDISGGFVATNIHTEQVTLNGDYSRSGTHRIETNAVNRVLEYSFSVQVFDLVGPRGSRLNLAQKVSGVLEGQFTGTLTLENPAGSRVVNISRDVRVEIADGVMTIYINGERYVADPSTADGTFHSPPEVGG
ncbi:MAG: hypothetical protein KatS3mg044_0816 [Rhodothermaceae bacterium]|nr:MAG: hypothetical protein KatS3mg044_0816 [Rhodothermaceae bacterium]